MADQKINALPSKTAPTTGDKMLMVGTAEEYLIDYDKLATAILNKLSSQSFSSLDTTAKTVLGAVNELNSKWLSGNSENNIDYNNLKAGLHYCGTGCAHAPENYCRVLCMYSSENPTNDSIQVAYPVLSSKIYMRKYGNPGIWTEWIIFSDDATLPLPLMNSMREIHTGWIRVAKYQAESTTVAQGSKGYGALLTIKSFYSNRYPVYYIISFHAGHQISGFTIIDSYKGNGILQKIRHTVDTNTNTAYIELNISDVASENNAITVTILDNIDGYGDNKWVSVNAEATNESVSGVTVVSSLSLQ